MNEAATIDPEHVKRQFEDAQAKYLQMLRETGDTSELLALESGTAANTYWATVDASIKFFAVKGHLTADLTFDISGKTVHFDAWPWGLGQGFLGGIGKFYGVAGETLVGGGRGRCGYHCQWGVVGGGFLQVTFWREKFGALGQLNVAAGGEGIGETGGDDGQFTWA